MSSHNIVSMLPLLAIGECKHTFTVITEAHLGLAQADGVLALTDPIELFEFRLVDALDGS